MVQVISNLGAGSGPFSAITIVRPILVSLAFGIAVPMVCWCAVLPLTHWMNRQRAKSPDVLFSRILLKEHTALVVHTSILVAMITGAAYAGTSNLFAAYLAGAAISWWDSDVPHDMCSVDKIKQTANQETSEKPTMLSNMSQDMATSPDGQITTLPPIDSTRTVRCTNSKSASADHATSSESASHERSLSHDTTSGHAIFEAYYYQSLQRILKPFFFASIGFSIPITRMFTGAVVWRGLGYTLLMYIAKIICGLWLVKFEVPGWMNRLWPSGKSAISSSSSTLLTTNSPHPPELTESVSPSTSALQQAKVNSSAKVQRPGSNPAHRISRPAKPISLYPGGIVGCAMVARGEIGFLISSLAEANGIFGAEPNGELFLIVTWAIMLCTIIGPVMVGAMVNRLKSLSDGKHGEERRDILGVWGLTSA